MNVATCKFWLSGLGCFYFSFQCVNGGVGKSDMTLVLIILFFFPENQKLTEPNRHRFGWFFI